jgi:hypothetical protein
MKWRVAFYNERRGILAHYGVDASSPGAAVLAGRNAALAQHPSPLVRRRRLSLFERAERAATQDDSGWVLYRFGKDNGQGSTRDVHVSP